MYRLKVGEKVILVFIIYIVAIENPNNAKATVQLGHYQIFKGYYIQLNYLSLTDLIVNFIGNSSVTLFTVLELLFSYNIHHFKFL